jgi:transposase
VALSEFEGKKEASFALEATTGWRFVVEEIERAGLEAHLAEPADTRALRGKKKRAKTDRLDARHLRELLAQGRLPESWIIPPSHIQDLRTLVRMRKSLVDERTAFLQRIHAQLFHHGHPQERGLLSKESREHLERLELPQATRRSVDLSFRMIEHINEELKPIEEEIEEEIRSFARRQAGCRALMGHYGIGELTSVAILAELGDTRRFSSSRHAVRYAGLDVTVHSSDDKRAAGKLTVGRDLRC